MAGALALAVDVGSSAVRVAAVEPDGCVVGTARVERPDSRSGVVFDPLLLWDQLAAACRGLSAAVRSEVGSLAIAGHIGTVFLDSRLLPVGTGLGWADVKGVESLRERLGGRERELLRSAGRPAVTGGAAAASLWLRSERPDDFARVAHIVSPKDYLVAMLCGIVATDHTTAAYTGLSRVADRDWDADILDAVGLDRGLLPRQLASTDLTGELSSAAGEVLGLRAGTAIVSGGPDGTVGAAFVIGDGFGMIADVAGTTDVVVGLVRDPGSAPREAMVNPYPLGGFSAGGATGMTGGALARWADLLGYADSSEAMAALASAGTPVPGAGGLRMLPTLSGGRFPRWRPDERGRVWGQRDEQRREDFVQAAAEGAAFVVREGIDLLDGRAGRRSVIALAGGAARSRVLAQMRADVLDREVVLCDEPDVSLFGAALLAFRGSGVETGGRFAADERTFERLSPDRDRAERYESVFRDWQSGLDVQTTTQ